jgi:Domain of unknown function (DUF6969)
MRREVRRQVGQPLRREELTPAAAGALERRAAAAADIVAAIGAAEARGGNLVTEALAGREFVAETHYPDDDVRDPATGAQYYFHAHRAGDLPWAEAGHFHVFTREADGGLVHLIAISMDQAGRPRRLFTVNQWVTGGRWRDAAETVALARGFAIGGEAGSAPVGRFVSAMLVLFAGEIAGLLRARDRAIAARRVVCPGGDVFEDRALAVTSVRRTGLDGRLARLRSALGLE